MYIPTESRILRAIKSRFETIRIIIDIHGIARILALPGMTLKWRVKAFCVAFSNCIQTTFDSVLAFMIFSRSDLSSPSSLRIIQDVPPGCHSQEIVFSPQYAVSSTSTMIDMVIVLLSNVFLAAIYAWHRAYPRPYKDIPYSTQSARQLLGDIPDIIQFVRDGNAPEDVLPTDVGDSTRPSSSCSSSPFLVR